MRLRTRHGSGDAPTTPATSAGGAPPGVGHARMAGWSGVLFALLFTVALVLVKQAPGLGAPDEAYAAFYSAGAGNALVVLWGSTSCRSPGSPASGT